jgi:hypothetical protein
MSSNSASRGMVIFERVKYGITQKAAMGQWKTDPSSSVIM